MSILTSLAVSNIFFTEEEPFDIFILPYDFQVINEVGFVLDADILHFGGCNPGAKMVRDINLSSKKDARVNIVWSGPGDLIVSKNNFILEADTVEVITFTMYVPETLDYGNYSGEVVFSFYEK